MLGLGEDPIYCLFWQPLFLIFFCQFTTIQIIIVDMLFLLSYAHALAFSLWGTSCHPR